MLKKFEHVQNYIFDMDGTLINSSEEVLSCLKKACYSFDAQINEVNFNPNVIGPPLKDIVKAIIVENENEELVNNIHNEFRRIYDNDDNDTSSMYENVYEWLIALKDSGKRLFMATNKPTFPTNRLIEKLNLNMFEDLYTIDKHEGKLISKQEMIEEILSKYDLNKSETIMVGDAPSDTKSAHSAGIKAIGVLWGYGNHQKVLKEISDFVIEINDLKVLQKI